MKSRNGAPLPKNEGNDPMEPVGEVLGRVLGGLQKKLEELEGKPPGIGSDILGVDGTLTYTPSNEKER